MMKKYFAALVAGIVVAVLIKAAFRHQLHHDIEPIGSSGDTALTVSAAHPMGKSSLVVETIHASPVDVQRLKVLDEILTAKNDNDPRLDSEFRGLSTSAKRLMEDRYHSIAAEKRNERGTIVFLVGREISSAEDVAFMGSVLAESPCLSLGDCSREEKLGDHDKLHEEIGVGVTLAYPSLVALHSLEEQINRAEAGDKLGYMADLRRVIESAAHSANPLVAEKAMALRERLKNLKS